MQLKTRFSLLTSIHILPMLSVFLYTAHIKVMCEIFESHQATLNFENSAKKKSRNWKTG